MTEEPVDFATEEFEHEGKTYQRKTLSRLTNGDVLCCVCFGYFPREQLAVDPGDGKRWDVCQPCWEWEATLPGGER